MTSPIDYDQLREMTRNFLAEGVSAVETNAILQGKFGPENSPTLCTIYKWRRELRGGMGEREANDRNLLENETAAEDGGKRGAKAHKKESDKYCVLCDKEMSSRHYYELHMLKIHNIFVGDSKALYELLGSFGPKREKKVVYRCDECFGGELDYELLEDLRRHRLLEHGRKMREKFEAPANYFEPLPPQNGPCPSSFFPSSPRRSTPKIRRSRSTVPFAYSPRKDDDRSTDESGKTLRRSARVPKPSPALIQSLLDAKEIANFEQNEHGENEDNAAEPIVTIMKDGRIEVEERREPPRAKGAQAQQDEQSTRTGGRTKPKKSAGGAKKRTMSPDAMDAADSMLKLAFTEQAKQQNGGEMDKERAHSQQKDSAEETKADKRRKSFSVSRPNRHDDCTWFAHSVAASLRQMPIQTKELAKTRIQQVIYECTSPNIQKNCEERNVTDAAQRNGPVENGGTDKGKWPNSIV